MIGIIYPNLITFLQHNDLHGRNLNFRWQAAYGVFSATFFEKKKGSSVLVIQTAIQLENKTRGPCQTHS